MFLLKLHNCKNLVLLLTASAACSKLTIAMIIFHALEARMAWKERKKSCTLNKAMPSGICYFLQTELYCSHAQWDDIFLQDPIPTKKYLGELNAKIVCNGVTSIMEFWGQLGFVCRFFLKFMPIFFFYFNFTDFQKCCLKMGIISGNKVFPKNEVTKKCQYRHSTVADLIRERYTYWFFITTQIC